MREIWGHKRAVRYTRGRFFPSCLDSLLYHFVRIIPYRQTLALVITRIVQPH